jgi:hypothetical protein
MDPNSYPAARFRVFSFACSAIVLAYLCGLTSPAATFIVGDALDTTNITSLRGAVIAANAEGGANIIVLTNSLYHLGIPGADEDAAFTGDLDITNGSLTIIGSASSQVVIDATGLGDRAFHVFPNAQLNLTELIVTGGIAPGGNYGYLEDGESGGAIYNMGTLLLENCVISNNASGDGNYRMGNAGGTGGGAGGGIYNSGFLEMDNCVVAKNASGGGADGAFGGDGGGIYNLGECVLTSCTISNNSAGAGGQPEGNALGYAGDGGNGGGIFNSGTLTLIGCVLSGNSTGLGGTGGQPGIVFGSAPGGWGGAGGSGAGLYNAGALWMTYCTVSSNSCGMGGGGGKGTGLFGSGGKAGSGGSGAGIYNAGGLNLNTCTMGGNICGYGGSGGFGFSGGGAAGGPGGDGGAICNSGWLKLVACTMALNSTGIGGNGGGAADFGWIAPAAPGGEGGSGGGIVNTSSNATSIIWNTLAVLNSTSGGGVGGTNSSGSIGNAGLQGSGPDGDGHFLSQGFNLIGRITGMRGLTNGLSGDFAGDSANPINANLSPLQMNGGTTLTFALLPGSPAIDAGDDSLLGPPESLTVDQRGNPRRSGAHVDIGAFEYNGMLNGVVLPPSLTDSAMAGGGLQFWFNGASGLNYSIWASSDLVTWIDLGSASEISRGWFFYQDSDAPNHSRCFYQVRYP